MPGPTLYSEDGEERYPVAGLQSVAVNLTMLRSKGLTALTHTAEEEFYEALSATPCAEPGPNESAAGEWLTHSEEGSHGHDMALHRYRKSPQPADSGSQVACRLCAGRPMLASSRQFTVCSRG